MIRLYIGTEMYYTINVGDYNGDFQMILTNGQTTTSITKSGMTSLSNGLYAHTLVTTSLSSGKYNVYFKKIGSPSNIIFLENIYLTNM